MSPSRTLSPVLLVASLVVGALLAAGPAVAAEHGEALWLDLVTEDGKAAAAFYEELFGWDIELRRDGSWIVRHQGSDIAALYEITDDMPNASESQWLVGVVVDDLERAVASSRSAGGENLRDITEVSGSGRYAVIRDPQGAILVVGTPAREIGGPRQPGYFVWVELWTHDLDAAADFYGSVLGYQRRAIERPGGEYTVFETAATPRAGLMELPDEDLRPAWAPYIGVADLRATVKRTVELGGRVVVEPSDDFGGGRVALIEDPTQAMIFVVHVPPNQEGSR